MLVEVDSAGNVLLSGIPSDTEAEPDQVTFHGEPWDVLERFDIRFEVLPLEAYPGLDAEKIELATIFAQANPPRGRPRAGSGELPTGVPQSARVK